MSRRCDAIACPIPTAPGKFMCLHHWRMVPIELQRTIYDRFRTCRKDFGFLRDVTYLTAAVNAIDLVAARDQVQGPNPYGRHLVLAKRAAQGAT